MFRAYPEEDPKILVLEAMAAASSWIAGAMILLCCWYALGLKFRVFSVSTRSAVFLFGLFWVIKLSMSTPYLWVQNKRGMRLYGVKCRPFRFGVFCALLLVISGVCYAWVAFRLPDGGEWLMLLGSPVIKIGAGFGLLRRQLYGLVLATIELVIWIVVIYQESVRSLGSIIVSGLGIGASVLVLGYLWKRAQEFPSGRFTFAVIGAGKLIAGEIRSRIQRHEMGRKV